MTFKQASGAVLAELQQALSAVPEDPIGALCDALQQARAVFVTGEGRSGLVARCFAMRLAHLGLRAHVVGGTTAPVLGEGDALLAVSRTGETAVTCTVARLAAEAGGEVLVITSAPNSSLASCGDLIATIPQIPSQQYGGSAFEQSALIALDAVVMMLRHRLGVTDQAMDARHANLE
ncbi:MAG: 6-phospho-3-hexuloisomerase [Armatimonadota bacterium]